MAQDQFQLFKTRRFWPLFLTQFLGAFNDNLFKNALVILITYVSAEQAGLSPQIMVTIAVGIFILPFFLFSASAGQIADKYEKSRLIRSIKRIEIVIMAMAGIGFYINNIYFLLFVLFLMGTQSTFFGPLKYGILPDHLQENELIGGNALIEAGTFVSILTGTILGGLLILAEGGIAQVAALTLMVAIAGWAASCFIPNAAPAAPNLKLQANLFLETWKIIKHSRSNRDVFLSILGISWFWLIGATFLSQFPTFAKNIIGGNEQIVTLFLTLFSIGIAIGSLLCNKLLKGDVNATFVPLGALGITLFTLDLFFASMGSVWTTDAQLIGARQFLETATGWRIVIDLFLISVSSGIYIVPLYAIMQSRSENSHRARVIASNNVMNALFMVVASIATVIMLAMDFSVTQVFLVVGIMNAFVAIYISKLLPDALLKSIVAWFLNLFYRVEVHGLQNFRKAGDRVVIVANHLSFLDAALISAYLPDRLTFAVNTQIAKQRWMKPFLALSDSFAVDPTNPLATRALIEQVKQNKKLVIFPEGRLTVTGSLMKVYEGPGMIADKAKAQLLPVRIEGAQYTPFTRLKGKVRMRLFPKITLTFLAPTTFDLPEDIKGRKRRRLAADRLYRLMTDMLFESSRWRQTLFDSLLDAKDTHGGSHPVAEDMDFQPINYFQLVLKSLILGKVFARHTKEGEITGVLLPNALGNLVTFFALQSKGRVPAMLNFSTGPLNIISACKTASIKTVYSSRRFVTAAKLERTVIELKQAGIKLHFLENLKPHISTRNKLEGFVSALFARFVYRRTCKNRDPQSPAVVLFTSGSEGTPKGVVLSHQNLQANRLQVASCIDFGPGDVVMNALPMFHSFGLTAGTLLPVLSGIRTFLYPSPLHYRIIPELAYNINATILFGTDTFLSGYSRFANPYDFYNMRYVFAGAEKLKEETRRMWSEKFGLRIFEGYGATETSPVLSINTPMHNKPGTVGRLIPGIEHKLEQVPGIETGGRLWVRGPNIMAGYLLSNAPGKLVPPENGWYDTGDIVEIDETGFVSIKGRAKRFAKVGGEMVSLTAVESYVAKLWPENQHAVVAIPDAKKGEQLVLVTDRNEATRQELVAFAKTQGIAEISLPRDIKTLDKVPILGTGKTDYVTIQNLINGSA